VPPVETGGLHIPWYVLHGIIPEGLPLPQEFGNVSFSKEQQDKFGINEEGEVVDQATFKKAIVSLERSNMPKLPPPPPPFPLAGNLSNLTISPPIPLVGNLSNLTIPGPLPPIIVAQGPIIGGPDTIPPWWILHRVKPEGPLKVMGTSIAISFSKEQQNKFGVDEDGKVVDKAKFMRVITTLDPPSGPTPLPVPPVGNLANFHVSGTLPSLVLDKMPTVGPGGIPPWWILHGVKPEGPEKDMGTSTSILFSKEQQMHFGIDEDGNITDKATFTKAIAGLDLPSLPPISLPNLTVLNFSGTVAPIVVDPPPTVGGLPGIPPWWILHRVKPEGPQKVMGDSTAVSFSEEQQNQFGIDEDGKIVNNTKFQNAMLALTAPAA